MFTAAPCESAGCPGGFQAQKGAFGVGKKALKPGGGERGGVVEPENVMFSGSFLVETEAGSLLLNKRVRTSSICHITRPSHLSQAFFTLARDIKAKMDKKLVSSRLGQCGV